MPKFERLSPQDTSFLYFESPVSHMHVGSVAIFEDRGLTAEEINTHIEQRLDLVPRFRKKLMWVPYGQGRPVWVDDPHFDVRFHVRHTGLPRPGGERELLTLMGRLMSTPLDRKRPLWELWMVDLPNDRKAVIQKTHHCLIDGVSGVDLATVLLDVDKDALPGEPMRFSPEQGPSKAELLRASIVERWTKPAEIVRSVRAATRTPRKVMEQVGAVAKGLASFGGAALEVAPRTSLNQPIGPHRRFEVVRTRLTDLKTIKNRFDCTVNDVVLALVTAGLRHILESRGDDVTGLVMRAAVPVSVRDPSERMTYGNRVAVMFAHLPVGEADPAKRLRSIHEGMAHVKQSGEAVGANALIQLSDFAPPTIMALAARAIERQWVMNLVVTNVPGPQFPLYFRGGEMLEAFPFVPLVGTTTLGVAVLSYNGQINFGLSGDWDAVPDLATFAEGIQQGLTALLELAARPSHEPHQVIALDTARAAGPRRRTRRTARATQTPAEPRRRRVDRDAVG